MKYKVLKKFGNVEVGRVLETNQDGYIRMSLPNMRGEFYGSMVEVALMLHNGFLEEVDGEWEPKDGEMYWYVKSVMEVDYYIYCDDSLDIKHLKFGNCFRTEAEAQAKLEEVLKVLGK